MISSIFSKADPSIGGVTFDCTISESVTAAYESTEYAVETGFVSQDHIRALPKTITMKVASSDTPFASVLDSIAATGVGFLASKLPPLITGLVGTGAEIYYNASSAASSEATRSSAAWNQILNAAEKMEPFDVTTATGIYKNYHIQKLYYEKNKDNENGIVIVIEMKEIKQYSSNLHGGQPTKKQLLSDSSEAVQACPPINLGGLSFGKI